MIEGDNLEVLKLLQKSYAGKVKLIYIDPPYNTGGDFVYPDNFQDNISNYLKLTGQVGEGGAKKSSNTEASGRFHNRLSPRGHYTAADISPYFWPNGKMPKRSDWKRLAEDGFRNYRLKVGGLVETPMEFSLEDLAKLGTEDQITMHHCIQGWSGIAQWSGVPLRAIVDVVRPKPEARTVVFYSFGESLYGGPYYDTQSIENVLKPQCLLATHMNRQPLQEVYGAPLRLRVENQLGYKMVKWIERIEFIESETIVGQGEGGKNEDDEYFDLLPNI